jgi:hypothetical protein
MVSLHDTQIRMSHRSACQSLQDCIADLTGSGRSIGRLIRHSTGGFGVISLRPLLRAQWVNQHHQADQFHQRTAVSYGTKKTMQQRGKA